MDEARNQHLHNSSDDSLLTNRDISLAQVKHRLLHLDTNISPLPMSDARSLLKRFCKQILKSRSGAVAMFTFTLFALFADDVRNAACDKASDNYFFAGSALCLAVFLLDLWLTAWLRPGFVGSFYFVLDLISTLSLIPDIGWIWEAIVDSPNSSGSSISQVKNAGKASRAGSRSSKIVRVLRLLRLIRLVKLYHSVKFPFLQVKQENGDPLAIPSESRIGRKMSELTTKRVIAMVLLLLLVLPWTDLSLLQDTTKSWDYGVDILQKSVGTGQFLLIAKKFIQFHSNDIRPLILLSSQDSEEFTTIWRNGVDPSDLRLYEKYYVRANSTVAIFDIRTDTKLEAILSIGKTLFVCIIFALGALFLTQGTSDLVISPIEKMVEAVKEIAANPLATHIKKLKGVHEIKGTEPLGCWGTRPIQAPLETRALEDSIIKISSMLSLSFGEAGSLIVHRNLQDGRNLDPMLPGNIVNAVFAYCNVRQFVEVAEILQEDLMLFVNEIAQIVHHVTEARLGSVNRNLGDSFLLVWKVDMQCEHPDYMENLGDLSLISVLRLFADLTRSKRLQRYRGHPGLQRKMPQYKVKVTCSMHYGWAIEGAVGTPLKIDALYLSPHVNLAVRLEKACSDYGVPLVFSNSFFEILSADTRVRSRHLDSAMLSNKLVKLFTFDFDLSGLTRSRPKSYSKSNTKRKRKSMNRNMNDRFFKSASLFQRSKTLILLRTMIDPAFIFNYSEAMGAYESGDWKKCQKLLKIGLQTCPEDQPSHTLLSFLAAHDFEAPLTWRGYRELPLFN